MEIRRYQTADGKVPLTDWLDGLRDGAARARIVARLGYRVYYAQDGMTVILLLCAGDKSTQAKDIERAHGYWKDYQERTRPKPPVQGGGAPAKRSRGRRLH